MPFGLCNAPTTFMHVMNDVFPPFFDEFVIVYLDDILVFYKSWDDQVSHVRNCFDILRKEKHFVKMSKCDFIKTSLVYLGYVVGGGYLKVDPMKVEVIVK